CAFVLAFQREGGWLDFLCRFWLPEERIKLEAKRQRQFFAEWAAAGWLTATPGEVIDFGLIRREINALRDAGYAIGEIGYDPARATQLSTELREEDGFAMVEVRQGSLTLHEPSKFLEAEIVQRRARATGPPGGPNPLARWMVGNATKRMDANGGIAPDKKRSKDKIDFVSAAVTALSRIVGAEKQGRSYLETEEPLVL
ncbi:MAG TPA: terminase TerL endonuclease subunit, partial [Thermoanaerobaculia bacterium]|nr:terminase TerL endonuclease subunit [Thermoanaerobaculia bacterium]